MQDQTKPITTQADSNKKTAAGYINATIILTDANGNEHRVKLNGTPLYEENGLHRGIMSKPESAMQNVKVESTVWIRSEQEDVDVEF